MAYPSPMLLISSPEPRRAYSLARSSARERARSSDRRHRSASSLRESVLPAAKRAASITALKLESSARINPYICSAKSGFKVALGSA